MLGEASSTSARTRTSEDFFPLVQRVRNHSRPDVLKTYLYFCKFGVAADVGARRARADPSVHALLLQLLSTHALTRSLTHLSHTGPHPLTSFHLLSVAGAALVGGGRLVGGPCGPCATCKHDRRIVTPCADVQGFETRLPCLGQRRGLKKEQHWRG